MQRRSPLPLKEGAQDAKQTPSVINNKQQKLKGDFIMECYLGTILPWPVSYAPEGWALCQGQLIPIQQNSALFAILGTTYGGDGENNFALPNLCGRFPIGAGQNPSNGIIYELGNVGGVPNVTLESSNVPLVTHIHSIDNTVNVSGSGDIPVNMAVSIPTNTEDYQISNPLPVGYKNTPDNDCVLARVEAGMQITAAYTTKTPNATLKPFTASTTINVPAPTVSVESACAAAGQAASLPVDTIPPYLCLNYIIATSGYFPVRA